MSNIIPDNQTDPRLEAIKCWLTQTLDIKQFTITPASNDASFRRYFRVQYEGKSEIVMDAPPEKEDLTSFITIANALYNKGINVPKIIKQNLESGFLLLTDFGTTPYLDKLAESTADKLYRQAIDALLDIQQVQLPKLPYYSKKKLIEELELFPTWFLAKHQNITPPPFLGSVFQLLVENAQSLDQLVVHRDYHSRNLMITERHSPGIIDFQDAVIGPVSYDLVSLLRDCYIEWPNDKIEHWLSYYFQLAKEKQIISSEITKQQFIKHFDLMGLQRHLKVLGIFCRLNYRDNKPDYLNDLPLTLKYVQQICHKYDEFSDLAEFLDNKVSL